MPAANLRNDFGHLTRWPLGCLTTAMIWGDQGAISELEDESKMARVGKSAKKKTRKEGGRASPTK